MYKPSVIFVDLDGTILDKKNARGFWEPSQRTIDIIQKINKKIPVVPLTGRGLNDDTLNIIKQLNLDNFILWNGAKIFKNNIQIYSQHINQEAAKKVFDLAKKEQATIVLNSSMSLYTYTNSQKAKKDLYEKRKIQFLPDDFEIDFDVFKFGITSNTDKTIQQFIRGWKPILGDSITMTDTGVKRTFLEITAANINKGFGAQKYCEIMNLDLKKSMHIGDSMNDSFVKNYVGIVIAVKNSVPEYIALADYVTEYNFDDFGVADFLEKYIDLD